MMKCNAKWSVWIVIIVGLLFSACAGNQSIKREEEGVPDVQVLSSNAYVDFDEDHQVFDYAITHNVDTDMHTDCVTLFMTSEEEYQTITCVNYLTYQYYKSDDMWVLIDYSDGIYETKLNEEKFTNDSGWAGWHSNTDFIGYYQNEFYYMIYITDIDLENSTVTMRYEIDFSNELYDDLMQTTPVTLELGNYGATAYIIRINEEGKMLPWEGGVKFVLAEDGLTENNR